MTTVESQTDNQSHLDHCGAADGPCNLPNALEQIAAEGKISYDEAIAYLRAIGEVQEDAAVLAGVAHQYNSMGLADFFLAAMNCANCMHGAHLSCQGETIVELSKHTEATTQAV